MPTRWKDEPFPVGTILEIRTTGWDGLCHNLYHERPEWLGTIVVVSKVGPSYLQFNFISPVPSDWPYPHFVLFLSNFSRDHFKVLGNAELDATIQPPHDRHAL
jgi:hypothetical protein